MIGHRLQFLANIRAQAACLDSDSSLFDFESPDQPLAGVLHLREGAVAACC